jgi:hypothetical protein
MMSSAGVLAIEECGDQVALLFQRLDERQKRWVGGLLALMLPHGGIGKVARVAGLDEKTVARGKAELALGLKDYPDDGRVRRAGGGRPRLEKKLRTSHRNSPKSSSRKRVAIPKAATGTFEAA